MILIEHRNIEESTNALSDKIAEKLKTAIHENGIAKFLVSGGRSPIPLFKNLSKKNIPWKDVVIGLVDERFVDTNNEKSNEKLVREVLLQNKAKEASFIGLVNDAKSLSKNLELSKNLYSTFRSGIDVTLLGMGLDGHTASLFPKDTSAVNNLNKPSQEVLINTKADVPPFERISSTKHLINQSENIYLFMSGNEKFKVLKRAEIDKLPIAHFFQTPRANLVVYYNEN